MGYRLPIKVRAGISDAARHHAPRADVVDLDAFRGIKLAAMLDGLRESLPKCSLMPLHIRQAGHLVEKLKQALSGLHVALRPRPNPIGACGSHFDTIVPAGLFGGVLNHRSQLL